MSQPTPQIPNTRAGWGQIPFALIADLAPLHGNVLKIVYFVARHTFGWHVRSVLISYDEFISGLQIPAGRLADRSGLTHPETVRRAIEQAIAAGVLEREETPEGFVYRIPARYWAEANVTPQAEFWSYYQPKTHKKRAEQAAPDATTHNMRAPALTKSEQVHTQKVSEPPHKMWANESQQPAPEAAPQEAPIHTSTDTQENTKIDTFGAEKEKDDLKGDEYRKPSNPLPSKQYQQRVHLLNHQITVAQMNAKTAREKGMVQNWTEAQWLYEERRLRESLARLQGTG